MAIGHADRPFSSEKTKKGSISRLFAQGRKEPCFQSTSFLFMNYSIERIHFIIPIWKV